MLHSVSRLTRVVDNQSVSLGNKGTHKQNKKRKRKMKATTKNGTETRQSRIILSRLRNGGVHIVASKGFGKTNTKMVMARRFRNEGHRTVIFDTLPVWLHDFDKIPHFVIDDYSVLELSEQIELTGYSYFNYNRTYMIAKEPLEALNQHDDLLFVITIQDPDRIGIFIASVIGEIYRQNYRIAWKHGRDRIPKWTVFFIEESENVFDSTSLTKRAFNRIRKQYSELANLKIAIVSSSQRLQEVSTKFRSKMDFLIGRTTLDDFELKIRRLLRNSKHQEKMTHLKIGEFLWCPTDTLIQFPLFKQQGKPFDITSKHIKPQKRSLTQKVKHGLKRLFKKLLGV